jgi:hypothetical protein
MVESLVSLLIVILSCCSGGVHVVRVLSLGETSGVTSSDSLVVLSVGCGVLVSFVVPLWGVDSLFLCLLVFLSLVVFSSLSLVVGRC